LKKERLVKKFRKYVSYSLTIGGIAHFIEFGFAIYEKAYITSVITIIFGILDLLAAYIIKEKADPLESADDGRKSV
tara:strand:+ start:364 stop:591 length:228 start_codon:yes stop_codon:yes gene_type:complete